MSEEIIISELIHKWRLGQRDQVVKTLSRANPYTAAIFQRELVFSDNVPADRETDANSLVNLLWEAMPKEDEPDVYRLRSTEGIFTPGMIRNCQVMWRTGDAKPGFQFLAQMFPSLPAGVVLSLLDGSLKFTEEDEVAIVVVPRPGPS